MTTVLVQLLNIMRMKYAYFMNQIKFQEQLFADVFHLQYSQENSCAEVTFYLSYRPGGLQFYYKETPTQVFSCEYCEISKNTYFEGHLRLAASVLLIIKLVISPLFIKNMTWNGFFS